MMIYYICITLYRIWYLHSGITTLGTSRLKLDTGPWSWTVGPYLEPWDLSTAWLSIFHDLYPLVNIQKAIKNGPVEIVDLPINSMVIIHSYVSLPEGNSVTKQWTNPNYPSQWFGSTISWDLETDVRKCVLMGIDGLSLSGLRNWVEVSDLLALILSKYPLLLPLKL